MAEPTDVFGVGNALVDVLALVEDTFLDTNELAKASMALVDSQQQSALLEQLDGVELRLRSGGSAANTMIAISQSGGTGSYSGKVADDKHGRFYREDMQQAGVAFDVSAAPADVPTGTCLVLTTPDAERTMCTNLGVSISLQASDIDLDRLANSKIVYIEGYLWDADGPRAASLKAMEHARRTGVQVALTFSDMFLVDRFGDDFLSVTKELCDIVFCNADELRHLLGQPDLNACAQELGRIVDTAFVTDGSNGCHVVHRGEIQHVEGFAAKAVDTVGAGDAFAGGALYGLTNGLDYSNAARWGNYVASQVVQIFGARLETELADQVDKVVGR